MNPKTIVNSWDLWAAAALTAVSAFLFPRYLEIAAVRDLYSVGTAVLSTIFSVFFAALAIIMSSSDDDFIEFLEQEGGYSQLVATFRFTLIVLFLALVCSVSYYVYTYVRLQGGATLQPKTLLISFEFLFLYGLFAALASALDTISYARYRSSFLSARKAANASHSLVRSESQQTTSRQNEAQMTEIASTSSQVQDADENKDKKKFEIASDVRKFEITLFWTRSLFFWGFIAAAFVAIAALKNEQPTLSLLISEFGVVCSLAWTLGNRGSKYWQEQWESKIEQVEDRVTGPLFKREESPKTDGPWLRGRRYSVSRLAIAVSDSVLLLWAAIYLRQVWICLVFGTPAKLSKTVIWLMSAPVVAIAISILRFGKSTPRPRRGEVRSETQNNPG